MKILQRTTILKAVFRESNLTVTHPVMHRFDRMPTMTCNASVSQVLDQLVLHSDCLYYPYNHNLSNLITSA